MERLMKSQAAGNSSNMDFMRGKRVFEINPEHPIIRTLSNAYRNSPDDEEALRAIDLLHDTALVSSGFTIISLNVWRTMPLKDTTNLSRPKEDKARKATGMQVDVMEDGYTDQNLFSLLFIKGKRDLAVEDTENEEEINKVVDSDDEETAVGQDDS